MHIDGSGLRVLGRAECMALLATTHNGRIAVSSHALPLIAPVCFAIDGEHIVISIRSGTTLEASTRDAVVAFEASGPDGRSTVGWSVHLNGLARHVTDPVELRRLDGLPLPSPTFGRPQRLMMISTDRLSGRAEVDIDERPDPALHSTGCPRELTNRRGANEPPHGGPSTLVHRARPAHDEFMTTDAHGITSLDVHTCLELLRTSEVGRLAVSTTDEADIFPVNYVVDRGTVVFRTGDGTKLAAVIGGGRVAFEADGYDREAGEAWSVVVKGYAIEIEQIHQLFEALDLPLFPWHSGPKPRFVRIEPVAITGRRFHALERNTSEAARPAVVRAAVE